jgi:hypothetical protein
VFERLALLHSAFGAQLPHLPRIIMTGHLAFALHYPLASLHSRFAFSFNVFPCVCLCLHFSRVATAPIHPIGQRPCVDLFVAGFNRAFGTVGGMAIAFTVIEVACLLLGVFILRKVAELRDLRQGGQDIKV